MKKQLYYFSVLCVIVATSARRGYTQGKVEDYKRAGQIKEAMQTKVLYAPTAFKWLKNQGKFWYLQQTPRGKEYMLINAVARQRSAAFDQGRLALLLTEFTGTKIDPFDLPFQEINFIKEGRAIDFAIGSRAFELNLDSYTLSEKKNATEQSIRNSGQRIATQSNLLVRSPDGKWDAFIRNSNVYIKAVSGGEPIQLSIDGSPGEYYSADLKWSPDSKKLATYKTRPVETRLVYLIESSPEDQLQPKLHSRTYAKPGDALPQNTPALFNIDDKRQVLVTGVLVDNAYSLSAITWRADSRAFTFDYSKRGFQLFQVLEADAVTGNLRPLITETSKTFITREKRYRMDINDGREIIWASERDGWNHLYLYDGVTGNVKNQITRGNWVVRRVVRVDEANRTIIFEGSGREAGQDPYLIQYYRVNFDGSGFKALTTEDGNHTAFFSDDYSYFADTYSRMDKPPVAVLRSAADGKVVMPIEEADISALISLGWRMPEVFHTKGRDNETDIWGIITRPSNFDPAKKYPIVEYIYAGPHESFVPKSFNGEPKSGDYRLNTALSELAELGFIVVQMDGMGTSNRSKAFHDVCWKNLKDAGFPDRIKWITEAARRYPYMDTTRVGIYGNSAGGQSSVGALLFHPEFYKVAVSSSGCHDNRMDKISWNESWMGYPVGPQYEESSNVTHAANLRGKLMLILGEMDTNVPPESTLQLVNALIKANKEFDFLMIPGMGHSLGGDYGEHKRRDFLVKHLLDVTPPAWDGQNLLSK